MHLLSSLWASALLSTSLLVHAFPSTPFYTSAQFIHSSAGANFTYIGVNWPGAGEVMIPEGLQYASIASIVSKIKSLGMNVVRLTFAIEMVDDVIDGGGDVSVRQALRRALGEGQGEEVWRRMREKNPGWAEGITRVEVFDAVAAELNKQGIYVHLDNHMSKGKWCCSTNDGNSWFGDTDFNVANWKRGLQYMAEHGKSWPNFVSLGLRNELRQPSPAGSSQAYTWPVWYTNMISAANLVHAANPDILIFLSGLNFDTQLTPIPDAEDLGNGQRFRLSDFSYADKLVLELHNYQNSATSCSSIESGLWNAGFRATWPTVVNRMPVVLTEFGFSQADSSYTSVYATCLRKLMPQWQTGWMVWALGGSYYIRSGTQDYEETWGLLNHDWSAWRRSEAIEALKGMVRETLASVQ